MGGLVARIANVKKYVKICQEVVGVDGKILKRN